MTLIQRLEEQMSKSGSSRTSVARSIGVSPATLSLYLSGTYRGDIGRIDSMVSSYLARETERSAIKKFALPFVETSIALHGFEALRTCHVERLLGAITGRAGIGKTALLQEYVRRCPDAILIRVIPTYSLIDIVRELHKKLGLGGEGLRNSMIDEIIERLRDSGRLLIIDESEYLSPRTLETLRCIHDLAHVGLVLCGLPRLVNNLRGRRGDFEQLYNRVEVCKNLSDLLPEDVEDLVKSMFPENSSIWKTFYDACGRNTRVLEKLMRRSARIAEVNASKTLQPEHVLEARKMLIV